MKRILENYRPSDNVEVLVIIVIGMMVQSVDGSPFTLKERWRQVWATHFPPEFFAPWSQKLVQSVLSLIVALRCLLTYPYVSSGLMACWSVSKDSSPHLLWSWLFVAGFKSIGLTILEALAGLFVCSSFGRIRGACVEFFIAKALELLLAIYSWVRVLDIYNKMTRFHGGFISPERWMQIALHRANLGVRKARSLIDESTMYKSVKLNQFEMKVSHGQDIIRTEDVPKILLEMLKNEEELSQDSLLGRGMMLASISNFGSYDHLKTSQSLGELGTFNLENTEVIGLTDEKAGMSRVDKVMKFMKLTPADITEARARSKLPKNKKMYELNTKARTKLENSSPKIPHRVRKTQIFIRDLPDIEFLGKFGPKKKCNRKKFYQLTDKSEAEEEKDFNKIRAADVEYVLRDRLMSNLTVGPGSAQMFRTKADPRKANTFASLMNQEEMSVIGPELFDKSITLCWKQNQLNESPCQQRKSLVDALNSSFKLGRFISFGEQRKTLQKTLLQEKDSRSSLKIRHRSKTVQQTKPEKKEDDCEKVDEDEDNDDDDDDVNSVEGDDDVCDDDKDEEAATFTKSALGNAKVLECAKQVSDIKKETSKFSDDRKEELMEIRKHWGREGSEEFENKKSIQKHFFDCSDFQEEPKRECRERRIKVTTIRSMSREQLKGSPLSENGRKQKGRDETENKVKTKSIPKAELMNQPFPKIFKIFCELREAAKRKRLTGDGKREPSQKPEMYRERIWKSNVLEKISLAKYLLGDLREIMSTKKLATRKKNDTDSLYRKKFLKYRKHCENWQSVKRGNVYDEFELGPSSNEKLKTESQYLRPMVLIGNQESGWASCSSYVNTSTFQSKTYNKSQDIKRKDEPKKHEHRGTQTELKLILSSLCVDQGKVTLVGGFGSKDQEEVRLIATSAITDQAITKPEVVSKNEIVETGETSSQQPCPTSASPEDYSIGSKESVDSFSLFYSQDANLASPLFDTKRFIYPDHIHYSYKNMRTKGFDLDITGTGGLPLLIHHSLTMDTSLTLKIPTALHAQAEITRRPMDLSFAEEGLVKESVLFATSEASFMSCSESSQSRIAEKIITSQEDQAPRKNFPVDKTSLARSPHEFHQLSNSELLKAGGKSFSQSTEDKPESLIDKLLKLHSSKDLLGKFLNTRNKKEEEILRVRPLISEITKPRQNDQTDDKSKPHSPEISKLHKNGKESLA